MKSTLRAAAFFAAIWAACPAAAQSITGTVIAADTGAPLPGVTVNAILKPASASQMPAICQSAVDGNGAYAIAAAPGQYLVCARPQPQSLYLDPCEWGAPAPVTVGATAVPVPLTLQKGVRFILRVHDPNHLLAQAETAPGTAVSAFVTSPSIAGFPLAVVYSDGLVRDYGTVVPVNVPLSLTVSSSTLSLADATGAALAPTPMTFQALTTDVGTTAAPPSTFASMFPPPDAKVIHIYATGLH